MPDTIRVSSIQRLCVNDGPGVRTVVFLKGCYLQCPWCCNPETIHYDGDAYFDKGKCIFPQKSNLCINCELQKGAIQKENCPLGAFERTYSEYDTNQLLKQLLKDETLYAKDGGVTFSGGEPLLQAEALLPLLKELRERNIQIAFETSLFAETRNYQMVKNYVDYWLVDLKFQYGYIPNSDYHINIEQFEYNLRDLQLSKSTIVYRMVVMSEALDRKEVIVSNLLEHKVSHIELLACHSLALYKYKELGKRFPQFGSPSREELSMLESFFTEKGINSTSLSL